MAKNVRGKMQIENVIQPGKTYTVDATKFEAVREAYLKSVPDTPPGLTVAEIRERLTPRLPQDLFPNGEKAGWWAKAVQLDLEAKGVLARTNTSPIRLYRTNV